MPGLSPAPALAAPLAVEIDYDEACSDPRAYATVRERVGKEEGGELVVERPGSSDAGGSGQERQYLERGRLTVDNGIALAAATMAPVIAACS